MYAVWHQSLNNLSFDFPHCGLHLWVSILHWPQNLQNICGQCRMCGPHLLWIWNSGCTLIQGVSSSHIVEYSGQSSSTIINYNPDGWRQTWLWWHSELCNIFQWSIRITSSAQQVWTEWESTTVILAKCSGKSPCFLTCSFSFDCSTHVLDYKHLTRAYSCTFPSRRLQSLMSLWAIALQTHIPNGGALSMHKECSKWMLMCNMDCMILGLIECGEGHNAAHWRGGAKTMSLSWGLSQMWQL